MDIQINITEDQIRASIQKAIQDTIQRMVEQFFIEEYGMNGYRELMRITTEKAIAEMPKYFEDEKDRLIKATADRLATGLKISNHEILTALLTIAESEGK